MFKLFKSQLILIGYHSSDKEITLKEFIYVIIVTAVMQA